MDKTQGFPAPLRKDIQITSAMFIREFLRKICYRFLKDVDLNVNDRIVHDLTL